MKGWTKRSLDEVLAAIEGSSGIKRTIAQRLGVTRVTVDRYLRKWRSAQDAYDEECQVPLDNSEFIIQTNLKLQLEMQRRLIEAAKDAEDEKASELLQQAVMNTADAKWYLTMKGGGRGYAPTQKREISGDVEGEFRLVMEVVDNARMQDANQPKTE